MIRSAFAAACLALVAMSPAFAISPGDDLLIAGAARTDRWTSDLYINNPGATTVTVTVAWLVRGQTNPNPETASFDVGPDETLILEDFILDTFGQARADGAVRITATGPVTANLIVFAGADDPEGTYGSGFEGIPANAATSAGETTNIMGLVLDDDFYTNIFALAGASGATMDIDLLDADGDLLDTANVQIGTYQPWFSTTADLWDVASFAAGTVQVRVSAGSMVMLGSKIDILSNDPTTLEQAFGGGGGSIDGTYQFAIYDSLAFASGGNLVIDGGIVEAINGTYFNFDKLDGGESACTLLFLWGIGLNPTSVEDFSTGVVFTDQYDGGGEMQWTVTFTVDDNMSFSGSIDAVGSGFTGIDTGCNGAFPILDIEGGKSN